jgi:hypothetical protein
MYFSSGFRANVETISLLSRPHAAGDFRDFAALKKAYQLYTSSIQPDLPVSRSEDIEFSNDLEDLKAFARSFNEETDLSDIRTSLLLEKFEDAPRKLETARNAYQKMQERYPELGLLFKLAFNTIFSLPSTTSGGGSTSSAIGVLWVNPRATWSENDMIEFLIHELTHNLVFLDERRHSHYVDLKKAVDKENWALSAVLARPRPIDKVVHSLVVATEILLFRDRFTGHDGRYRVHPPSGLLKEKSLRCAESLLNLKNREELCRPRFSELTLMCREKLESLSLPKSGRPEAACA